MTENGFRSAVSDQPPLVQLIFTFVVVVIAGTILFYIFLFIGSLIWGISFRELAALYSSGGEAVNGAMLRYVQVAVQVSMFLIPSLFIIRVLRKPGVPFLRMDQYPGVLELTLAVILALMILPVMNYTGFLNSKMELPSWLGGVESWMREKEDSATGIIDRLIVSPGPAMLMLNVFILALIPALSEELMFRGVVQQLVCRTLKSDHAGIILSSVIFSTIHFQFYGFIPRFLLGLSFGYLLFWTRNIWFPVIAHFVYNSVPVVLFYFRDSSVSGGEATPPAAEDPGVPWLYIVLSVLIFYYFRRASGKSLSQAV